MALRQKPRPVSQPWILELVKRAEFMPAPKPVEPEPIIAPAPPDPEPYQISIKHIQRAVALKFNIEINDLLSERRNPTFTVPRHVTFVLCRILTLRSYPEIGRRTGNRDHTTVIHGVNKYRWLVDQLRAELKLTDFLSIWVARAHELVSDRLLAGMRSEPR